MDFGVRPVGIHYRGANGESEIFGDLDRSGIENVGACREANVEAIAALDADLFVATQWDEDTASAFCLEPAQLQQIEAIAPVVRISAVATATGIL